MSIHEDHREALANKRKSITIDDLYALKKQFDKTPYPKAVDRNYFETAFLFLVQQFDRIQDLLQVAEQYRDQMKGNAAEGSLAWITADAAIKNYYQNYPDKCPHRLKYLKTIEPTAAGCETTVIYCPDCDKELTEPQTDC